MNNDSGDAEEDEQSLVASDFATLVSALVDLIGSSAFQPTDRDDRLAQINLLLEGISEFGVDGTSLVRWGMTRHAWQPILVLLIVTPEDMRSGPDSPLDFEAWFGALGLTSLQTGEIPVVSGREPESAMRPVIERAITLLPRWVQMAPIQDILSMTAPAPSLFEQIEPDGPAVEVRNTYSWIVERSSESDMTKWSFASLQNEFRWREETWVPPFVTNVIETDRSTDDALHYALSARAAALPPHLTLADEGQLLEELKRQAVEFLRVGRHREAAALFEFYIRQEPDNTEAVNNLAFCLFPTDPEMALHHWESIGGRSFHAPAMLAYNRTLALHSVGRSDEALDFAERAWQEGLAEDEGAAYLWRSPSTELELYFEHAVRRALASLAAEVALGLGRADRNARWLSRATAQE